jgi:hypothetical protein
LAISIDHELYPKVSGVVVVKNLTIKPVVSRKQTGPRDFLVLSTFSHLEELDDPVYAVIFHLDSYNTH